MPKALHLRKRLFAYFMSGSPDEEDDTLTALHKRRLFADLHGDILEFGPGGGANLSYLATRPDLHWLGLEPNPYMHPYLLKEAKRLGIQADLRHGAAEHIDLPDESVDAVVSTLVLCSVRDPAAALREALRVLRPGGRFVFIEHVAAPAGTRQRQMQNLFRPAWQFVGDGCHTNRETWVVLEKAGFTHLTYERYLIDVPLFSPHIAGIGRK